MNQANEEYGLTTKYQIQDDIATGKCAALIHNHDRSLVTDLAAANHFTPDHLQNQKIGKLLKSWILLYWWIPFNCFSTSYQIIR